MKDITDLYKQLCKKHNIELQECVQKALTGGVCLNLSNQTLDVGTCAVVGKLMQATSQFQTVNFEDCLMKEDSVKSILLGLCGNSSVKTLVLKGNCIQGTTTAALAMMLRHNTTLVRLSLEWNDMGLHPESFMSFCEAMTKNTSIQHLDLRSNHLGTETAPALALLLARNCGLTSLDLRWNSLGVSGSKLILESLQTNKTLTQLNLIGNNVTNDILAAVEALMDKNKASSVKEKEYIGQTTLLKEQLERHVQHSSERIKHLENSLAQRDMALSRTLQEGELQTGKLEEQLSSKSLEVKAVQAKYEVVTAALRLSQERLAALEEANHTLEEELNAVEKATAADNKKSQDVLAAAKDQHSKEVESLSTNITQLRAKVNELNAENEALRKQNLSLKESVCSFEAEVKGLKVECEEAVCRERLKHKEAVKEVEKQRSLEVQQLKSNHQQTEAELREKLASAEVWRGEAQAEVITLQTRLNNERSTAQAELLALKKQLKVEQSAVVRSLEEQLQVVEGSRSDAEERLRSQVATNSALQATNTKLTSQIHALDNDITVLKARVDSREGDVKAAEKRIREEFSAQIEELQQECKQITKLNNTISQHERHIGDLEHERDLYKREAKLREDELKKFHEDEARRVGMLHSAFVSYFNSSPGGSPSKTK